MRIFRTWEDYFYPGTTVLRNKLDIRDPVILARADDDLSWQRLVELRDWPIAGKFDVAHYRAVHRYVFQDLYDWAGEFRTTNMGKGLSEFAKYPLVEQGVGEILLDLHSEDVLRGRTREQFCERGAYYFWALNMIHGFREGNGRAQKEFIRMIGEQGGHRVEWNRVSRGELISAASLSVQRADHAALVPLLLKATPVGEGGNHTAVPGLGIDDKREQSHDHRRDAYERSAQQAYQARVAQAQQQRSPSPTRSR